MFTPLRSDRTNMCWHKSGPVIHWCLAQLTFLIIPICSIVYWAVEFKTVHNGFFAVWFLVYPLMNVLTIFPIYFIIRNDIIKSKRAQLKKEDDADRRRLEKLDEEELDEDEYLKDGGFSTEGYGVNKDDRDRGAGPYRLHEPIEIREDLYSMIFATCFHPEYVKAIDDEKDKKEALLDEIIEDFKAEPNKQVPPYGVKVYADKPKDPGPLDPATADEEYFAELKKVRRRLRYDKDNFLSQLMAVWLFQVSFTVFILIDAMPIPWVEEEWTGDGKINLQVLPKVKIAYIRFVAGMIMHVQVNSEIVNGMRMMKYTVNHWWKFKYHRVAFLTGFLQMLAMVCITLVNYLVITISNNVIDIAKDFTALMIIADFDDIFGEAGVKGSKASDIVGGDYEDLFKVETTTSHKAAGLRNRQMEDDEVYNKMVKDADKTRKKGVRYPDFTCYPRKRPKNIYIKWEDRHWENKCLYMIYRIWRLFHVSCWFYFFPFTILIFTYCWPLLMLKIGKIDKIER